MPQSTGVSQIELLPVGTLHTAIVFVVCRKFINAIVVDYWLVFWN